MRVLEGGLRPRGLGSAWLVLGACVVIGACAQSPMGHLASTESAVVDDDDDVPPAVDDSEGPSCDDSAKGLEISCGRGACMRTVPACDANNMRVACAPGEPAEETCDGTDENCDGDIDEGCACSPGDTQPCYNGSQQTQGVGECKVGVQDCDAGAWGACVDEVLPSPEQCDGLDNNCDGDVDEGNPEGGNGCVTGQLGVCAEGMYICEAGSLVCQPLTPAVTEVCGNLLDDDCDGETDEDCCAHDICIEGPALTPSCDSCVAQICAQDAYCCGTYWDTQCVLQVSSICGLTC